MVLTLEMQLISLIVSVFAGLIVGLLFDLYRTINYYTKPPRFFLNFMDLLFWIITAVVVFIVLLNADYAILRLYTFVGMGVGILIHIKLFSEYILIFYKTIFYVIGKIIRLVFITLSLPFKILYNITWMPIHNLKNLAKRFLHGAGSKLASQFKNNKKKK